MRKKDYETIAEAIKFQRNILSRGEDEKVRQTILSLVVDLDIAFKKNDPKYDDIKFWQACGMFED